METDRNELQMSGIQYYNVYVIENDNDRIDFTNSI